MKVKKNKRGYKPGYIFIFSSISAFLLSIVTYIIFPAWDAFPFFKRILINAIDAALIGLVVIIFIKVWNKYKTQKEDNKNPKL